MQPSIFNLFSFNSNIFNIYAYSFTPFTFPLFPLVPTGLRDPIRHDFVKHDTTRLVTRRQ